jgi:hypothetical protein
MSLLFKCAQRWELVHSNPMQLVRVKDVSKRVERPSVLTAEEFHKVLPHVSGTLPYHPKHQLGCNES